VERIANRRLAAQAFVDAAKAPSHAETDDFNGSRMTGVGFNHTTRTARDAKTTPARRRTQADTPNWPGQQCRPEVWSDA
jgi:choline dehydrogenase